MGGKDDKTPKMPVVDYFLSVHFGLCHGPIDFISRIIVKDKLAWSGRAASGAVKVEARNLFGGNKKEGGVGGVAFVLPGELGQRIPDDIAARFGRTSDTMPGYRGIASVFFYSGSGPGRDGGGQWVRGGPGGGGKFFVPSTPIIPTPGTPGSEQGTLTGKESYGFSDIPLEREGGFYWASNNPYLPDTMITAARSPKGVPLPAALATIPNLVPQATVGRNEDPDVPEGEDPPEPDFFVREPQNNYYIGDLRDEDYYGKLTYGNGYQPITDQAPGTFKPFGKDGNYTRFLFDEAEAAKRGYKGIVYKDYGFDINPAHMILECLLDPDWGMGAPETAMDMPSFRYAANVLEAERHGLSMMWSQQTAIEDYVSEILDHIQGMIYLHPDTGLFNLKLLRNDYTVDFLRTLDDTNGTIESFQRKGWGDTTNEIVVTWTNPENEQDSTVTLQALGNIAQQGGVVSDSRNYYGVRNQALALKLCARDLASVSTPLATADVTLLREFWDIYPGESLILKSEEDGFERVVMRVMDVDYGRLGESTIKVKLTEDVFAVPAQDFYMPAAPGGVPVVEKPGDLEYLDFFTAPPQWVYRVAGEEGYAYPQVPVTILGATNTRSVTAFEVWFDTVNPAGGVQEQNGGTLRVTTHGALPTGIAKEFSTNLPFLAALTKATTEPTVGGLAIIGSGDTTHEIVMFESWTEAQGFRIARGMMDTVPRAWPEGTPVWILGSTTFGSGDPSLRAAEVEQDYGILSRTESEVLDYEFIQRRSFTPSERPFKPLRPANCKVDGQALRREYATRPSTVPLTWSNRNARQEDAIFPRWTEGTITPEDGQTTLIRVVRPAGTVIAEFFDLPGTSFDMPVSSRMGGENRVQFWSRRDGHDSLQAYEVELFMPALTGYGVGYGYGYGEG